MSAASPQDVIQPGFCTITGRRDTSPQFIAGGFDTLVDYLRSHLRVIPITRKQYEDLDEDAQAEHKSGPGVIFAAFTRPGVRNDDAVRYCTYLGLDVDEKHIEAEALRELLKGWRAIIYESSRSTEARRRWRVIIEFIKAFSVDEHARAFEHWAKIIPGVSSASRNPSRLWYGVQQFKGSDRRIFEVLDGQPFSLDSVQSQKLTPQEIFTRRIGKPVGEPAVQGDRNTELSRYAASIVREAASEEDLLQSLLDLNATYLPPMVRKEVRGIARSTWRKRAKFGWQAVPEARSEAIVGEVVAEDAVLDLADLIAYEPGSEPWIVDKLLTSGAHLLVGRPKGGKSWLTMDLAVSCALGEGFTDRTTRTTEVLWIASEDTKASLARRLKVRKARVPSGAVTVYTMEGLKAERALWEPEVSFEMWLRAFLVEHPNVGLVILDTQRTCEAIWQGEQIDQRRFASVTDVAYQSVRIFDTIGQDTQTCIVLVHHAGKLKNNKQADYHERINLPATAVAGATASIVLADHPEKDLHDDEDYRRVLAIRGRHIRDEVLLVEVVDGRVKVAGKFTEVEQSAALREVMEVIEALLAENTRTTTKEIASSMGKHVRSVQQLLGRAQKKHKVLTWKGKTLVIKQKEGVFWKGT